MEEGKGGETGFQILNRADLTWVPPQSSVRDRRCGAGVSGREGYQGPQKFRDCVCISPFFSSHSQVDLNYETLNFSLGLSLVACTPQ